MAVCCAVYCSAEANRCCTRVRGAEMLQDEKACSKKVEYHSLIRERRFVTVEKVSKNGPMVNWKAGRSSLACLGRGLQAGPVRVLTAKQWYRAAQRV